MMLHHVDIEHAKWKHASAVALVDVVRKALIVLA
jgi:hypothetical protein